VVEAHQPGKGPKFTHVEMSEMTIVDHGNRGGLLTCQGTYEGPQTSVTLKFMRVWLKKTAAADCGRFYLTLNSVKPEPLQPFDRLDSINVSPESIHLKHFTF